MIKKLLFWLDDRTGYKDLLNEALYERIPGGARWRYVWGSTLMFTFSVQCITGLFLWSAYSPSAITAWESVYYIQEIMYMGSLVRGIHHFTAQAMIVLLALHLIQVVWDGAYKAPREVNFWLGLILMQIILGLSLTGYLLPWDQKGYYATQVSTNIMGVTPIIGAELQNLAQGGPAYGHHTLTRFFAMHAGILPASLIGFVVLHIYVFRRHGITVRRPDHAPEATFWPDQVLKDGVACLAVLAVVLLLAVFKGAELGPPANPAEGYEAARPEWYFLFLFRFLKFEAVEHFGLAFGAIYVPGILMTILALMPIIAIWKRGHKFNIIFMCVIAVWAIGLTGLALYEDANNPDHQAAIAEADRDAERVLELAERPTKIPVEGAVTLLREDPFTQGPRIFTQYCSSCHRYDGHNGRGRMVIETDPDTGVSSYGQPTAADLGNLGSREWMRSIVVDYAGHLAALRHSTSYQEGVKKNTQAKEDEGPIYLDLDSTEMANWSGDREALLSDKNKEHLDALIEYLVLRANHKENKIDKKLAELGKTVASEYKLVGIELNCSDCHTTIGNDFNPNSNEFDDAPDIAEYASGKWLRSFISDPGSEQHYGAKNLMPAYKEKMTEKELDLLVRWFTKDHFPTEVEPYPSKKEELRSALQPKK